MQIMQLNFFLGQKKYFRDYTELRGQRNTTRRVTLLNGNITANSTSSIGGVSARVYKNGVYGFASAAGFSEEDVKNTLHEAEDNALFFDSRLKPGRPPLPLVSGAYSGCNRLAVDNTAQKQILDFTRELDDHIASAYPKLAGRTITATCLNMEKVLAVSQGSDYHSFVPRSYVYVFLTVEKDGEPFELFDCFGGCGTFQELYSTPSVYYEDIDTLYKRVCDKSCGVFADAGMKQVVLAPELAGMLAHEAVGHTSEGDYVLSGSVSAHNRGKQVASPLITLVDFANTAFGKPCPIPVYVDDEGTPATDAVLIENGILRDYMHSKDTAMQLFCTPTGNARAYAYSDEPLVRMRNTVILPGADKLNDMIATIDDGYYLISTSNGQADSTGEFTFGISMGYEIKKGKLGRAIKNTTISGVAFDMLKTVDMLSDDIYIECNGMCGKKQYIPVALGGPAIKCRVNVGGR